MADSTLRITLLGDFRLTYADQPVCSVNYDFAHDIVRQVAYKQLSEPRRRLMHQQIARVLNNLCAVDSSWIGEVAHHADLAGDHSLAAAQQCLRLFAYAEASELAARGIQHCQYLNAPQRILQQLKLLRVTVLAGVRSDRVPQLEHTLQQQIEEASRLNWKEAEAFCLTQITHHMNEIALAWIVRIRYLWACGQREQAREQLQDLRHNLEESGLSDRTQRAIAQLIQTLQF